MAGLQPQCVECAIARAEIIRIRKGSILAGRGKRQGNARSRTRRPTDVRTRTKSAPRSSTWPRAKRSAARRSSSRFCATWSKRRCAASRIASRATPLRWKRSAVATISIRRLDPIVRVEAMRLRRALNRYYANGGRQDPVQIDLPLGSYVPGFAARDRRCRPARPARFRRRLRVDGKRALAPAQLASLVAGARFRCCSARRLCGPRFLVRLQPVEPADGVLHSRRHRAPRWSRAAGLRR